MLPLCYAVAFIDAVFSTLICCKGRYEIQFYIPFSFFWLDSLRAVFASACLINHAFVEWRNQIRNIIKKKNTTHLTSSCKDENECYCTLNDSIIKTAFNLVVTRRNMNLLSSFNKIYNFNENYHLLQPTTVNYMSKLNYTDQATLIGELQVQEKFDIENVGTLLYFQILISK